MVAPAQAQIQGDGTLNTRVNGALTAPCTGTCVITDGTARGGNLFHSFHQFSLPNGDFAGFVTPSTVQNVIVRVTGVGQPFVSNINGTVATTNAAVTTVQPANFFLLNPNGLVFGPKARVLTSGSFLATTADQMVFQDGTAFRTTDPTPLLTVSVPVGLGFTEVPKDITLQGSRLSAANVALVGGNIQLDNAQIGSSGGGIALTGIGAAGVIGLDVSQDTWSVKVPDTLTRADVALSNNSILAMPAASGGDIVLKARNLKLSGGGLVAIFTGSQTGNIVLDATDTIALSQGSLIATSGPPQSMENGGNILIQTGSLSVMEGSGFFNSQMGQGNGGSIIINARDRVAFDGETSAGRISAAIVSNGNGLGKSGEIQINTGSLSLTNGASLLSLLMGNVRSGNAGDIIINARDAVVLSGEASNGVFGQISSNNGVNVAGNSGNIKLSTGSFTVTNGAYIGVSSVGQGNAGTITIDARDAVVFDGRGSSRLVGVSGASGANSAFYGSGGNGGDIQITARSLSVTNGANLNTSTFGQGNGGNINIDARNVTVDGVSTDGFSSSVRSGVGPSAVGNGGEIRIATNVLAVTNGANLTTGTQGQGNGGRIVIDARDRTVVNGFGSNGDASSIQSAVDNDLPGQAVRKGGDLAITTGSLLLNGGFLSASVSSTLGEAGNINVRANNVQLDNALIGTTAASGNGGNITLFAKDLLLLRRNSIISARSGTLGTGQGDGGNIVINTPFLISAPLENSDIRATAFGGRGGSVTINATGIYWFVPRSRTDLERLLGTTDPTQLDSLRLPTNDITAISQANPTLNGQVVLNTPDLDPSRGLVALPTELVDPSNKIDQRCAPKGSQQASSFTVTGRGGLASSPTEPLMQQGALTALVKLPEVEMEQVGSGLRANETDRVDHPSVASMPPSTVNEIIEANGWIVDAKGSVRLVVNAATEQPSSPAMVSLSCAQR
ncbi:MAG: filamentous hemagglutinin N-terminal domain-containing protein [Leptolyngbya sp. BL-A-14]